MNERSRMSTRRSAFLSVALNVLLGAAAWHLVRSNDPLGLAGAPPAAPQTHAPAQAAQEPAGSTVPRSEWASVQSDDLREYPSKP
ncbi:MAG: hypothetical protein AB9869_13435 [Verrucomicrobiia bacterium]